VPGSSNFSRSARDQAREILSKPPFRSSPSHVPRPLAGVFHALGRALNAAIGHPAEWFYHHALLHLGHGFQSVFGGWWLIVAALAAVGVGVLAGTALVRRRARISNKEAPVKGFGGAAENPDQIERQASDSENAGDHETAVRLRFRAGLLRLQSKGVIANQGAQTTRHLSEILHSPIFDALADRHEVIVYAGDRANPSDSETARTQWPRLVRDSEPAPGAPSQVAQENRSVGTTKS
jgi:hypothetical protein